MEAIASLPSRDAKVEFIGKVNEQRRAGATIGEAISTVEATTQPETKAARAGRTRSNGALVGRPPRLTLPFVWRAVGHEWSDVDVHPSALATTRLAAKRSATLAEWREAISADLTAFRDASASAPDDGGAWASLVGEVSAVLGATHLCRHDRSEVARCTLFHGFVATGRRPPRASTQEPRPETPLLRWRISPLVPPPGLPSQ